MFNASVIALHRRSRSHAVRLGDGTATVGTGVGADVGAPVPDAVAGAVAAGVPLAPGVVLPAACGDSVGEGAALP